MDNPSEVINQLAVEYAQTPTDAIRNRVIEAIQPLLCDIANKKTERGMRYVGILSADDLASEAVFGVIECLNSFDPARGWKFMTYVARRIRGRMADAMRDQDWVPRIERRRVKVIKILRSELGREPTWPEVFDRANQRRSEIPAKPVEFMTLPKFFSLQSRIGDSDGRRDPIVAAGISDSIAGAGLLEVDDKDAFDRIVEYVPRPYRRHRLVLKLYYTAGMTMKAIGTVVGTSESRVSQIHSEALAMLKAELSRAA